MSQLKEYHFSAGNSSRGAVGFCARVRAESKKKAVEILREAMPAELAVHAEDKAVIYLEVYFNDLALRTSHIDEVEDVAPEEDAVPDDKCRECGEPAPLGGDGWDGLCGNCADRAESRRESKQ
jgi:hypothetical protein